MKYKFNDKVVVVLDGVDAKNLNENGTIAIIRPGQILGKLSDFTKPKKIKFSVAEKKEFDDITDCFNTPWAILNHIAQHGSLNPNLKNHLFESGTSSEKIAAQIEFVKALEHPELIEVVEEKKYYIKMLDKYLGYHFDLGSYALFDCPSSCKQDKCIFNQSEIDKLQKLPKFQAIDLNKSKEEVEE